MAAAVDLIGALDVSRELISRCCALPVKSGSEQEALVFGLAVAIHREVEAAQCFERPGSGPQVQRFIWRTCALARELDAAISALPDDVASSEARWAAFDRAEGLQKVLGIVAGDDWESTFQTPPVDARDQCAPLQRHDSEAMQLAREVARTANNASEPLGESDATGVMGSRVRPRGTVQAWRAGTQAVEPVDAHRPRGSDRKRSGHGAGRC